MAGFAGALREKIGDAVERSDRSPGALHAQLIGMRWSNPHVSAL